MSEALHTEMLANVSVGWEVSESFSVISEVKQGCVLALTLFSIFLSAMFDEAFPYIQSRQSADQRRTLQSEDQDYLDTDERAAIRRCQ